MEQEGLGMKCHNFDPRQNMAMILWYTVQVKIGNPYNLSLFSTSAYYRSLKF
jgi:hypothetical protein